MCLLDLHCLGFQRVTAATTWPRLLCPGQEIVKPHRHRLAWRVETWQWRRQLDRSSPPCNPCAFGGRPTSRGLQAEQTCRRPNYVAVPGGPCPPCRGDCLTCRKRCRQKHWKHSAANCNVVARSVAARTVTDGGAPPPSSPLPEERGDNVT